MIKIVNFSTLPRIYLVYVNDYEFHSAGVKLEI